MSAMSAKKSSRTAKIGETAAINRGNREILFSLWQYDRVDHVNDAIGGLQIDRGDLGFKASS
jgi:hypothetical protein